MEFLMTYGWSILIIAVVLGALFSMGVFNSANFAPRASPGSCKVLRVAGTANLEGICSGERPQSVAQFNGGGSRINIGQLYQEAGTNQISFAVWFNMNALPNAYPMVFGDTVVAPRSGYDIFLIGSSGFPTRISLERFFGGASSDVSIPTPANSILPNTWYFAAATYDGSTLSLYLNGNLVDSRANTNSITPDSIMSIGAASGTSDFASGMIANFQIYNTSLDAPQVMALYQKGIGAAPVVPANIVGWWPLNGDANDYSGNNNNGAASGITYTSAWTGGYARA